MQSKTSSFKLLDRTFFIKNLKRCWPVWAGYTFLLLWLIPGEMYFDNSLSYMFEEDIKHVRILRYICDDYIQTSFWLTVFFAIILAVVIFSYIQNERACNLIHALPLTRESLYSTGFISGMIFMAVPDVLVFIVTYLVALKFDCNCLGLLLQWLLMTVIINMLMYSLAMLSMVIVGSSVVAVFCYAILIGLVESVIVPLNQIAHRMYYGMYGDLIPLPDNFLIIISPARFFSEIPYTVVEDSFGNPTGYEFSYFWVYCLTAFIVAALLLTVGFVLYHKRKSESAGDIIAIEFLRPIFRWFFAIIISILMTWMFIDTIFSANRYINARPVIVFILAAIFAVVAYIIAEMMIRKSFRIFAGIWKKLVIFTAVVIASLAAFIGAGKHAAFRVVDPSECDAIYMTINYHSINASGINTHNAQRIYDIHKYIVEHYDDITNDIQSLQYTGTVNISVTYDGVGGKDRSIMREYMIPNSQHELFKMIEKFTNDNTENFVLNNGKNSDAILVGGSIYIRNYEKTTSGMISEADARILIDAIKKDIAAGNLSFSVAVGYGRDDIFKTVQEMGGISALYSKDMNDAVTENQAKEIDDGEFWELNFDYRSDSNDYYYYGALFDTVYINKDCIYTMEAISGINISEVIEY